MTIVNYPQLHHLGFKVLCTWYMIQSIEGMNASSRQKRYIMEKQDTIINLLKKIKDK